MANVSVVSSLNTGRDVRKVVLFQDGIAIPDLCVTGFSSGQDADGQWRGQLHIDRTSQVLEEMQAKDPVFWILVRVKEMDGSETEYMYTAATLRFADAGTWMPDAVVPQRISFTAKYRTINGHFS